MISVDPPTGVAVEDVGLQEALSELGRFAADLSWSDQPSEVRDATARVLSDSVAVMIAGGR